MGGKTRISIALFGAIAAVLALTFVVPAFGAGSSGEIRLVLDADNPRFEYDGAPAQSITTARNGCQIDQFANGGESLIDLSPDAEANLRNLPLPGFSSDSIGIKSSGSNSNGTPCSQVDGPEPALNIGLGSSLSTQYAFEKVRLDLEMTGDAVVRLSFGGVVGQTSNPTTYFLETGTSITVCDADGSTPDTGDDCVDDAPDEQYYAVTSDSSTLNSTSACAAPNSSGPNSGGNDNCLWTVDPGFAFTTISLDVVDIGTVSLEGGSDTGMPSTFGIALLEGTVSGLKWRDHDNDGKGPGFDDEFEQGIGGWTIKAFDTNGVEAGSAETGDDGTYTIGNLPYGDYTVCEFPPTGDPSYLTWYQSTPTDQDGVCADIDDAEPDGWLIKVVGDETGADFFNVRSLTLIDNPRTPAIDCGNLPPGGVIETQEEGQPLGSITIDPDDCKPGEYVFETYVLNVGGVIEQVADFYPLDPGAGTMPIVEDYTWLPLSDAQLILEYDDTDPFDDLQPMLFCELPESQLAGYAGPLTDFLPDGETSCLFNTTEDIIDLGSGVFGVERTDRVFTLIDGRRTLR